MPCMNQVFRTEQLSKVLGQGECKTCQTHPDNVKCSQYQPVQITIKTFEISEKDMSFVVI